VTSTAWNEQELAELDARDEVRIASVRKDGTLTSGRIIWAVRLGDEVYVRSVNGRDSAWFRGTRARNEGRIEVGGLTKDVAFVDIDASDEIEDRIDRAYASKYRNYAKSIIDQINSPEARAATIRLVPR
jgi:hypothetical protein